MKQTAYCILLNIKTGNGYENFGKFFVNNHRNFAYALFEKLQGSYDVGEKAMLTMELMESVNGLPFNLKMISCTLEELMENCRLITKETFKAINLEDL